MGASFEKMEAYNLDFMVFNFFCFPVQIPPLPPKPVTTVSAAEAKSKKQLG